MFNIGGFFQKFSEIHAREVGVRSHIVASLKKHCGIDCDIKDVVIKNGNLTIKKITNTAKSTIFIKKESLLAEINNFKPSPHIKTISF